MSHSRHSLEPFVFDDEEAIEALSWLVLKSHQTFASGASCFSTLSPEQEAKAVAGRVQSVLANTFCTIYGQSPSVRFDDIYDQVSYLAEHMAKDHIFQDGNKRTSLVFSLSLLMVRGLSIPFADGVDPENNPYYLWIQDMVSGKRTREELARELRENCCWD